MENILRRTIIRDGVYYVILKFNFPDRTQVCDHEVRSAADAQSLRPIQEGERSSFDISKDSRGYPIVIFGETKYGSAANGGFPGYEFWNTSGKLDLIEHWTRGPNGDSWETHCEFLFVKDRIKTP